MSNMRKETSTQQLEADTEINLNCLDIESDKDKDVVDNDAIQKEFSNEYHASAWQSVCLGKKSTYVTHLASNEQHSELAAVLSDNSVALFDWPTLKPTGSLRGHEARVTGIRYLPDCDSTLVSCSLDGSLRQWDTRSCQSTLQHTDVSLGKPKPLTCVDANSSGRYLCTGTELVAEDAYLLFWDTRRPQPLGGYWQSHTDDVSTVKFHPSDSGALATGSTDGYVNVFDVTQTSEDEALQATLNTLSSVSSVTWYERAGERQLAVVLDTEALQCWEPQQAVQRAQFSRVHIAAVIRRTMSEVCYVAGCHRTAEGHLLAVAGAAVPDGGCLRLLQLDGDQLLPHALLRDTEVTQQLVRASVLNTKTAGLVTAGEGGVLTLWQPGPARRTAATHPAKLHSHPTAKHRRKPY